MEKQIEIEVAKEIWNICKKSPEHGNAVMDVINLWRKPIGLPMG